MVELTFCSPAPSSSLSLCRAGGGDFAAFLERLNQPPLLLFYWEMHRRRQREKGGEREREGGREGEREREGGRGSSATQQQPKVCYMPTGWSLPAQQLQSQPLPSPLLPPQFQAILQHTALVVRKAQTRYAPAALRQCQTAPASGDPQGC